MVRKSISENQNKKRIKSSNSNFTTLLCSFSDSNEEEGFIVVRKVFGIDEVHHLWNILNLHFES